MNKNKKKQPTTCISEDSSADELNQSAEHKKEIAQRERLRIYDDAALLLQAMAKRKKRQVLADEALFFSTGSIYLKEADTAANGSSIEYQKGKLLQEALFLRRLFRKKRWRKMRWKFELADQEIVLWPDAVREGKKRYAIRIQMV